MTLTCDVLCFAIDLTRGDGIRHCRRRDPRLRAMNVGDPEYADAVACE